MTSNSTTIGEGRLEGKVALVTGGASGIGAGIAQRFVAEGARCLVVDLDGAGADRLADVLGDRCASANADVTSELDIAAAVTRCTETFGGLDIMVNNAGVAGASGSIVDIPVAAWDQTVAVLLRGVFLGIKHATAVMRDQESGVILNIASLAGLQAGHSGHAYTAAKHGVVGLTGSAAVELAPAGIRVNAIAPGGVATPLVARTLLGEEADVGEAEHVLAKRLFGRVPRPADVASVAAYLASDESWFVNGACIVVDGARDAHRQGARGVFFP